MEHKIDFTTFVFSVSSAAFMGLGMAPRPGMQKVEIDLTLARQNIELLEMIKEKTKNNLNTEEERLINNILGEVKMKYVEVSQRGAK